MAKTLHLSVVTPSALVADQDVNYVGAQGLEGDFGVLPGHAPFMTTLREGVVTIYDGAVRRRFEVKGGFADINAQGLSILAEEASEIVEG